MNLKNDFLHFKLHVACVQYKPWNHGVSCIQSFIIHDQVYTMNETDYIYAGMEKYSKFLISEYNTYMYLHVCIRN